MNENENALQVTNESKIMNFSDFRNASSTDVSTFSNIKDSKKLFNLETKVDHILNECVGEKLRIKEVLIKKFVKPLREPFVDEETGEILKDTETKISCILIDDNDESYATGSKTFAFNMIKLLGDYEGEQLLNNGIEIEVIKVPVPNSPNKALSFKLI